MGYDEQNHNVKFLFQSQWCDSYELSFEQVVKSTIAKRYLKEVYILLFFT